MINEQSNDFVIEGVTIEMSSVDDRFDLESSVGFILSYRLTPKNFKNEIKEKESQSFSFHRSFAIGCRAPSHSVNR